MKFILAAACAAYALLGVHSCAQAAQSDDIAVHHYPDGRTLGLSSQECIAPGYMWWHLESRDGRTMHTGCWTLATRHRYMILDGHGGSVLLPISDFAPNPDFELGPPHATQSDYDRLNSLCRGGHGDDPKTLEACKERDAIK